MQIEKLRQKVINKAKQIRNALKLQSDVNFGTTDTSDIINFIISNLQSFEKTKFSKLMHIKETKEQQLIRRMFKEIYDIHFRGLIIKKGMEEESKMPKPNPYQLAIDVGNYVQGTCPIYYQHLKKKFFKR